jgi:Permeases of the drug/metabolite transporter (DMT) superfamily
MPTSSLFRLLLLAALWGGSFLLMRITAPVLGAIPTAFGRVLTGTTGLFILIILRVPCSFHNKLTATLILGAVNSGIPFLMFSLAAQVLPAGYSAILNATTPLMGVIIGAALFGEHITLPKSCGVLIGLAGVAVLTHTGPLQPTMAVLLGIIASLPWAAKSVRFSCSCHLWDGKSPPNYPTGRLSPPMSGSHSSHSGSCAPHAPTYSISGLLPMLDLSKPSASPSSSPCLAYSGAGSSSAKQSPPPTPQAVSSLLPRYGLSCTNLLNRLPTKAVHISPPFTPQKNTPILIWRCFQ